MSCYSVYVFCRHFLSFSNISPYFRRCGVVKNCDRIAVLDDGGVAELGSHDELLKKKGLYHELWTKQGAQEEEEEKNDVNASMSG